MIRIIYILILSALIACNSHNDYQKNIFSKQDLQVPGMVKRNSLMGSYNNKKFISKNAIDYNIIYEEGDDTSFCCFEIIPEFPGGYDSLVKFLTNNLKYPKEAIRDNIEGTVLTSFIVEKNGDVTNERTLKGIRHDLDYSCIRAISRMPRWIPAKSSFNRNARVQFNLPIRFVLN
jgi:TonB family protein